MHLFILPMQSRWCMHMRHWQSGMQPCTAPMHVRQVIAVVVCVWGLPSAVVTSHYSLIFPYRFKTENRTEISVNRISD